MAACVWEVQTPTLLTSATAHPGSKVPTVRRGWTGAACSHAGMVSREARRVGDGGGDPCMVSGESRAWFRQSWVGVRLCLL